MYDGETLSKFVLRSILGVGKCESAQVYEVTIG